MTQAQNTNDNNGQTYEIASFGCGVDSVAGLVLMKDKGFKYDEIIFADTGSEKDETYAYLDYLTKTLGWNITVVKSKYGVIYDYYFKKRIYPVRFVRDCTGKFKIDPFNKYLRTKYGKTAHFNVHVFIDYAEQTRVRTSKYNYSTLIYPLIEHKITRDDCIKIIQDHNMPVPVKSGCFFCPFTPPKVWRSMKMNPDTRKYFDKSLEMEKNSRMRNKKCYPLVNLRGKETMDLFDCGCFNYNTDEQENEKELMKVFEGNYTRGF